MENNNQELNNQVNTNSNQQVQPNNNKMLITLKRPYTRRFTRKYFSALFRKRGLQIKNRW